MANVKRVAIEGVIPFNVPFDSKANQFLGLLNQPSMGLRIHYSKDNTGPTYVPNESGGKTAMFWFLVAGQEAVRDEWLKAMCQAFVNEGGIIKHADVFDAENEAQIPFPIDFKKQ